MAVTVDLDQDTLEIVESPPRVIVLGQPLVGLGDRFLVIQQRFDIRRRRFVYVCEQTIHSPNVLAGIIIDERWEFTLADPLLLVIDERWDLVLPDAPIIIIDERWDVTVSEPGEADPVSGAVPYVIDERWEG